MIELEASASLLWSESKTQRVRLLSFSSSQHAWVLEMSVLGILPSDTSFLYHGFLIHPNLPVVKAGDSVLIAHQCWFVTRCKKISPLFCTNIRGREEKKNKNQKKQIKTATVNPPAAVKYKVINGSDVLANAAIAEVTAAAEVHQINGPLSVGMKKGACSTNIVPWGASSIGGASV